MEKNYTIIKTGRDEFSKVSINDILHLKAFGNYTDIVLDNGSTITVCQNIKTILNRINNKLLIRINRSTAVNINKIIKIKNGKTKTVKLTNDLELKYSKKYIPKPDCFLV